MGPREEKTLPETHTTSVPRRNVSCIFITTNICHLEHTCKFFISCFPNVLQAVSSKEFP